jgi:hypothetical protein
LNLQNVQKRKKKDVIKNSKGKNDRAWPPLNYFENGSFVLIP